MSDFSLGEVARCAGKNPRTIRRWCELGRVHGAYRLPSGHWRVSAPSEAAAVAGCDISGFARCPKSSGSMKTLEKNMRKASRAFAEIVQRPSHKILMRAVEAIDLNMELLDELGLEQKALDAVLFTLPSAKTFRAVKVAALASWILRARAVGGRVGRATVARTAEMSRMTFERHFGGLFREAGRVVALALRVGEAPSAGFAAGAVVPVAFPDCSTPDEIRRFAGAGSPTGDNGDED